jgi:hypothetical protein
MKKYFFFFLAFSTWLTSCQPSETQQEVTPGSETAYPASPALRPDVAWLGYTSEETKLLAQPDFGAPTISSIRPLEAVEVIDTTDTFFVRVRINREGQDITGYIDRVYLSDNLETATLLHDRRGRR